MNILSDITQDTRNRQALIVRGSGIRALIVRGRGTRAKMSTETLLNSHMNVAESTGYSFF